MTRTYQTERSAKMTRISTAVTILLTIFATQAPSQTTAAPSQSRKDSLKSGFVNPPQSARPLVWWHWMNGNISKEGIKLDLQWMHRVGIGGIRWALFMKQKLAL